MLNTARPWVSLQQLPEIRLVSFPNGISCQAPFVFSLPHRLWEIRPRAREGRRIQQASGQTSACERAHQPHACLPSWPEPERHAASLKGLRLVCTAGRSRRDPHPERLQAQRESICGSREHGCFHRKVRVTLAGERRTWAPSDRPRAEVPHRSLLSLSQLNWRI